ncbi:hypothetical protein [Pedobacter alpinus]|uniref:Uncharacterized protein n=1 Tax=Pedobacter alpinus TaxID=1590643 RepID=A0ABW5TR98_9SPHI
MKKAIKGVSVKKRLSSPSPNFFNKIVNTGLIVGGIGTAILASPILLPTLLTTIAGYLVTAGLVASVVAAVTIEEKVFSNFYYYFKFERCFMSNLFFCC